MKKSLKPLIVSLILFYFIAIGYAGLAQEPPHPPPPPSEKGTGTNHGPAGAPIESGVTVLLAMGAAYGAFKLYRMRSRVSVSE
jgi:hypothetical protein